MPLQALQSSLNFSTGDVIIQESKAGSGDWESGMGEGLTGWVDITGLAGVSPDVDDEANGGKVGAV